MGAAENAELVRKGYAAFQNNDLDTVKEVLAPDVKWHATGRSKISGSFDGLDATLAQFLSLAQETGGTFKLQIHDVLASDDHVVVLGKATGERNGKTLDSDYCHVFHIKDGKASEAWVVPVDPYTGDEFYAD
jgi:ketosteroid isomerase-like protein